MSGGFWTGAGAGALLAYLADPQAGRRRRALLRDQFIHGSRKVRRGLGVSMRDASHRLKGAAAAARHAFVSGRTDDARLTERVRAALGRVVRHPGSIEVYAEDGDVILSGPVLRDEAEGLMDKVASVPGVRSVQDRLEVHDSAEGVPGLQGEPSATPREISEIARENWSPALRLAAAAGGLAILLVGGRVPLVGPMVRAAGLALLARAALNRPIFSAGEDGEGPVEESSETPEAAQT